MSTDANLTLLTAAVGAEMPVCIGYFEHGPDAGKMFVSAETHFGAQMSRRHVDLSPTTLVSTVGVWERIRAGRTPAEVLAAAAAKLPGWATR